MSAIGMASPVYVAEPPLSPPSPRASAQPSAPAPPPDLPTIEVATAPAPAAVPEPTPEPVAATPAPPPAARATAQRIKVFVRLANGERVEAGSFDGLDQAKERGAEIARTLAAEAPEWPFVAGRFLRP